MEPVYVAGARHDVAKVPFSCSAPATVAFRGRCTLSSTDGYLQLLCRGCPVSHRIQRPARDDAQGVPAEGHPERGGKVPPKPVPERPAGLQVGRAGFLPWCVLQRSEDIAEKKEPQEKRHSPWGVQCAALNHCRLAWPRAEGLEISWQLARLLAAVLREAAAAQSAAPLAEDALPSETFFTASRPPHRASFCSRCAGDASRWRV